MRKSLPPTILAAAGVAILGGSVAFAAVIARDLPKQLEFIQAAEGKAAVVYGEITASEMVSLPSSPDVPYTKLTVAVSQALLGAPGAETISVYTPGFGDHRLSISPPETETRTGEKVVLFVRQDATLDALEAGAYKLDSFAESFRTQTNRKGQVVVLGEGGSSAIVNNTMLSDLTIKVAQEFEAVQKANK